jgi:anti-sigma factor RsiW
MNAHPHGEKLSAYLDGMLDVAQMRSVAAHLAVCPQCSGALAGLTETKRVLHVMPAPERLGPEFWADAARRMRLDDQVPKRWRLSVDWDAVRVGLRQPRRRWSAGLATAALVAAAIATPLIYSQSPSLARLHPIAAAPAPDSVDVSTLVQAHAESAAREPLADTDRQDVIALDNSFAVDDVGPAPTDVSDTSSDATP